MTSSHPEDESLNLPEDNLIAPCLQGWKGRFQRINQHLFRLEAIALCACLYGLCLLAFIKWILETFFNKGYLWIPETMNYSMLWTGFLGASLATSSLEHFRIDLLRFMRKETIKRILAGLSYLGAFGLCAVLGFASIAFIQTLFIVKDRSIFYGYPTWPVYLIVVYFYLTSALRFLAIALMRVLP
jgi:TRAP-type C4-dicarboxylate transport system permease small subunit